MGLPDGISASWAIGAVDITGELRIGSTMGLRSMGFGVKSGCDHSYHGVATGFVCKGFLAYHVDFGIDPFRYSEQTTS